MDRVPSTTARNGGGGAVTTRVGRLLQTLTGRRHWQGRPLSHRAAEIATRLIRREL